MRYSELLPPKSPNSGGLATIGLILTFPPKVGELGGRKTQIFQMSEA